MKLVKLQNFIIFTVSVVLCGYVGTWLGGWSATADPVLREIKIKARQYAYDPSVIRVNEGDTLRFYLASLDVIHGFYLEGHDLDGEIIPNQKAFRVRRLSNGEDWREVEHVDVIVNRRGKFRYRCSHTCGSMHPFMLGELIVEPNTPFHAGIGGVVGLFLGLLFILGRSGRAVGAKPEDPD